MIDTLERLTLNPVEFVPDRPDVSLHELGLEVKADPGPDYGETSVTVERVRQAIGEGVTDRRWPSVEATIPLMAKASDDVTLAQALFPVDATIAEIQRRGGGWLKREFSDAGGFAGSLCCPIDAASMTPAQGWSMAHNQFAPNMVLTLSRYPIWYATVEVPGTEVKGSEVRDLKWEIAEMLGTAPGLIRVRVKNEGATDWCGAMACIESDYLSTATTADLAYECEKLTLGSTAEVKERTGASGGKVVRAKLTAGWIQVLDSLIVGVGHMTHTGPRRMKMRVFDASPSLGTVQLQLESRALGASTWSPNRIIEAPLVGDFAIVDLGEVRPELAILGSQRWEWRLMARAPGGSGEIDLDRVWPLSTEQMLVVSTPARTQASEHVSSKSPGTVVDDPSTGTIAWKEPSNAKVEDGSRATASLVGSPTSSHFLKATNFGFTLPATAVPVGVGVAILRGTQEGNKVIKDAQVVLVKGGVIGSTNRALPDFWTEEEEKVSYGGASDLFGLPLTKADIEASTFGVAISVQQPAGSGTRFARINAITLIVYYSEAIDENKVCFATRSMEFSSEGVQRQHPTEDIWAPLISEAGSIFQAPPGGLEGRAARGIIISSQGDLGVLADVGAQKISILPGYHPGYLSAREAA